MSKNKIALITGATSGFGKAIALKFASEQFDVIILGRRTEKLLELKEKIESNYHVLATVLTCDVQNQIEVATQLNTLNDDQKKLAVLINNAGLALGKEPFHEGDMRKWEQMIDTNLKGVIYISRIVSEWMVSHKSGTIINIGSIAGKEAYAGGNVYSATKAAIDILTKNMRIDLLPYHIRVGQLAPGAADTEFSTVRFNGDLDKAKAVYEGFQPLEATDVADAAWFMASRPEHVCINDMVIMPSSQANANYILRS